MRRAQPDERRRRSAGVGRRADGRRRPGAMRLTRPVSTLPAPTSTKRVDAVRRPCQSTLSRQRTVPVTCSTRRRRISSGSVIGAARDVGDDRHGRRRDRRRAASASRHRVGGRLHQRAVERRGDRQQHGALGAAAPCAIATARSTAALRARRPPPGRRHCRWRPRRPRRSAASRGDRRRPPRGRGRAAPPSRPRRPAPPPASPRRGCAAAARYRRARARRRRRAPNIRRANGRRRRRRRARGRGPPRASSARSAASETAISAGWALAVSVSVVLRALAHQARRASRPAPRRPRRRRRAAAGKASASARPMPTAWLPCPGKMKARDTMLVSTLDGARRDARIGRGTRTGLPAVSSEAERSARLG